MTGSKALKLFLIGGSALGWARPQAVSAQSTTTEEAATPTGAETPDTGASLAGDSASESKNNRDILVTGSRIRQDPNNSALPLQIITTQELQRNGIVSPEQLIGFLTANGSGADNLASNSDVVSSERRGNNGASFANLRGQGAAATLVLLNGRRVAAQGTTGSAVDVNQIPFQAIERVEVLKDGASAIYGTDALAGVINFITKKDYTGFGASAFTDVTQRGDSPVYRLSAIAGYGDLDDQGFNVMGTVGYSWVLPLQAKERDFVNTFQHDRGLGVDTRGTPFATIVNLAGTSFPTSGSFPFIPGTTQRATGGLNILRLPGQPGCASIPDQGDYDTDVWAAPGNGLACTFDTGRNVYLQQKLETLTYLGRAVKRFGQHDIVLEVTGSRADSAKKFSQVQITPNTTTQKYSYKLIPGVNDATFNDLIARVNSVYPGLLNQSSSFAYRWRCMACGEREITTTTTTFRAALNAEGPLFGDWDYRTGISYAESKSSSLLGTGYYYRGTNNDGTLDGGAGLIPVLNSGLINPFLFAGQQQSAAGLAALQQASAQGVRLYGGKYSVKQADGSVAGSLFRLPAGEVKLAAGFDFRREEYHFDGDQRSVQRVIIAAPFDNGNALDGVHRDIKAAYAELLIPVLPGLEISAAGRIDDYTGFGTTTNPKVSVKFRPFKPIMFRGSYNTAFRVPTFNQIFNPQTESVYTGADYADPKNCPNGQINVNAGCPSLSRSIDIRNGGNPNLGPETAKEFSVGGVFEPSEHFSLSVDYWSIHRENTIQVLPLQTLFTNYNLFSDRFIRDSSGTLLTVDQSYSNAGTTRTRGIDFSARAAFDVANGRLSAGVDGTYLVKKDEQVNAAAAVIDELGVYSLASDLGLKWKYNAFVAYNNSGWTVALTQIFRDGYKNQVLPGIAAGTFNPPNDVARVDNYIIYNLSAGYAITPAFKITMGVKNLFDTDPPFAISYDSNFGSGSSWEPRVADPRGRAFTMLTEFKF